MAYGTVNADVIGTSVAGSNIGAGNASIMKNRIINGAMVIDQRNAGASVTPDNVYTLDRWIAQNSQTGKFTVQQNAGSVTPPLGFTNYLGVTSSSAYSTTATDFFFINQYIEGFNTADLGWGTANAKTVTLSFWVRSSLTGTFGGSLKNSASNRAYPFSYSIPVANTWTSISVTIAGDTSGTWLTNNGIGIFVGFGLGVGSTYSATAGSWGSGSFIFSATGATSVVGTSGATLYLTGIQLEVGEQATGFEYVNYQTSLANCQRYLPSLANNATGSAQFVGLGNSATTGFFIVNFPVSTRVAPTGATVVNPTAFQALNAPANAWNGITSISFNSGGTNSAMMYVTGTSGLSVGQALIVGTTATTTQILFTGCEL